MIVLTAITFNMSVTHVTLSTNLTNRHVPNPLEPHGDPEVRTTTSSGAHIICQRYEGGCLVEYKIAQNRRIEFTPADFLPFFNGQLLDTFEEDGFLYLTVWLGGCNYPKGAAHSPAEPEYGRLLSKELDIVWQADDGRTLVRAQFTRGWVYFLIQPLGEPFVTFPEHVRREIAGARVVSVSQIGRSALTGFWVPAAQAA